MEAADAADSNADSFVEYFPLTFPSCWMPHNLPTGTMS
jgi:hypothetical protein